MSKQEQESLFKLSSRSLYVNDSDQYIYSHQQYDLPPDMIVNKMSLRITNFFRNEFYKNCEDVLQHPENYTKKQLLHCISHFCRFFDYNSDYTENLFYQFVLGDHFTPNIEDDENAQRDLYYEWFQNIITRFGRSKLIDLIDEIHANILVSPDQFETFIEYPENLKLSYHTHPPSMVEYEPASSGSDSEYEYFKLLDEINDE